MGSRLKKVRPLILSLAILFFLLCCLGTVYALVQTKALARLYDNLVLDNRNHYLPCNKLPSRLEVENVVQEQQETIREILAVNPGLVGFEVQEACPGRADIVIWYASHADRLAIEKTIGSNAFFGIPYRLENR